MDSLGLQHSICREVKQKKQNWKKEQNIQKKNSIIYIVIPM